MYEILFKRDLIKESIDLANNLGKLNNSITNGKGNVYGFLGELIVCSISNAEIKRTFDYDIIYKKYKIDIKTKRCTSKPKPEYFCSIADFNIKQKCDYYTFVRIMEDFSKAWILGSITKDEFFKQATFNKKDEIDITSNFGWRFKADCYNLPISKLGKIT